jgi:hypothetical protein
MRVALVVVIAGCGGGVNSDREAELAYIGLDGSIERALDLGMLGFSQADSANIPGQQDVGDVSGTIEVTGQADQGSSDNKGLRLDVALAQYADVEDLDRDHDDDDDLFATYSTAEAAPLYADLKLRDIPEGTYEGTYSGDVLLEGDLAGVLTLSLTLTGGLTSDGGAGVTRVVAGSTVRGTVTNEGGGVYEVDLTR